MGFLFVFACTAIVLFVAFAVVCEYFISLYTIKLKHFHDSDVSSLTNNSDIRAPAPQVSGESSKLESPITSSDKVDLSVHRLLRQFEEYLIVAPWYRHLSSTEDKEFTSQISMLLIQTIQIFENRCRKVNWASFLFSNILEDTIFAHLQLYFKMNEKFRSRYGKAFQHDGSELMLHATLFDSFFRSSAYSHNALKPTTSTKPVASSLDMMIPDNENGKDDHKIASKLSLELASTSATPTPLLFSNNEKRYLDYLAREFMILLLQDADIHSSLIRSITRILLRDACLTRFVLFLSEPQTLLKACHDVLDVLEQNEQKKKEKFRVGNMAIGNHIWRFLYFCFSLFNFAYLRLSLFLCYSFVERIIYFIVRCGARRKHFTISNFLAFGTSHHAENAHFSKLVVRLCPPGLSYLLDLCCIEESHDKHSDSAPLSSASTVPSHVLENTFNHDHSNDKKNLLLILELAETCFLMKNDKEKIEKYDTYGDQENFSASEFVFHCIFDVKKRYFCVKRLFFLLIDNNPRFYRIFNSWMINSIQRELICEEKLANFLGILSDLWTKGLPLKGKQFTIDETHARLVNFFKHSGFHWLIPKDHISKGTRIWLEMVALNGLNRHFWYTLIDRIVHIIFPEIM